MKPYIYFIVGLPSCGKTTFRKFLEKFSSHKMWHVVSYDDYLYQLAKKNGIDLDRLGEITTSDTDRLQIIESYRKFYDTEIDQAKRSVWRMFERALEQNRNIIIDVPDMITKSRRKEILEKLPNRYYPIAIYMQLPSNIRERLQKRLIPADWDKDCMSLEAPANDEGFREIRSCTY